MKSSSEAICWRRSLAILVIYVLVMLELQALSVPEDVEQLISSTSERYN